MKYDYRHFGMIVTASLLLMGSPAAANDYGQSHAYDWYAGGHIVNRTTWQDDENFENLTDDSDRDYHNRDWVEFHETSKLRYMPIPCPNGGACYKYSPSKWRTVPGSVRRHKHSIDE